MKAEASKSKRQKLIIKRCHVCGQVHESSTELEKCVKCDKSFLPLNYFDKVHGTSQQDYQHLFAESHELDERDLIVGIYVLW